MSRQDSLASSFTHDEYILDATTIKHDDLKTFDVGLTLLTDGFDHIPLSPNESKRIRRKIDLHLLPLLFLVYTLQWIDKNTLSASSILGIIADDDLSTNEFNTAASAFFIGYLIFQWPQNWALQRFPVGKWMSFNLLLWSLFLGLHAASRNFGGLFVLRFLLGACEGCTNAGLVIVCSMFYTRVEVPERIGWTYLCNGIAQILSSFIQFGLAHVSTEHGLAQWQWFMVTIALVTFIASVLFFLFFPDNPTNAWFFTVEERVLAVRRVRENQNGIETKVFKKYQLVEALRDRKCWLCLLFMCFALLEGGIATQYSLIINSFGFTELQTTLLGIPGGFAQIIGILIAGYALRRFPNSRAYISMITWTPSIVSCFMELFIPLQNRTGRLIGIYFMYLGVQPSVIIGMSWTVTNTSGHTKKTTAAAMSFIGWSLGNTLGSQFWLDKYKPNNRVPWTIVLITCTTAILCTLVLRSMFALENKRRDALKAEALRTGVGLAAFEEYMMVETVVDGKVHRRRIDKMYLDLTDGENLAFRYIL